MKFLDLLNMSVANLGRRKVRTALTMLGVLIGTTAVVSMVSLGIGLQHLMTESFSQYSSLTAIEVRSNSNYDDKTSKAKKQYVNDELVKKLSEISNVESVSPVLTTPSILIQGVWQTNIEIKGVSSSYMNNMKLKIGSIPKENKLEYVVGNQVITNFTNKKTGEGYYQNDKLPDIDYMNKAMFTIFDVDKYYASTSGDNNATPPKKYIIKTSGVIDGGVEDYSQYSYGVYTDIEALKTQLKKIYKKNLIPGQPSTKKGKPLKFWVYNYVVVFVDDMKHVLDVQKKINDMGYQATSSMEWLKQAKQQSNIVQGVLGGVGAISLFVAAIGIANTMMMSIYERTKEIGIMKVLGCDMKKIRDMFLIESGFIGFVGGFIGLIFSYIIAFAINSSGVATKMSGVEGSKIAIIPFWLAISAVIFAILIGMLSGFLPAIRAMQLSPLAALRNE